MGWAGKANGALLRLAEQEFEVFLTADQKLPNQQDLPTLASRWWCLLRSVTVFATLNRSAEGSRDPGRSSARDRDDTSLRRPWPQFDL